MDPQGALERVTDLLESRPFEYDSIIALHRMNGMQRRGRIVIDLKRNSLWDKINPKTHQLVLSASSPAGKKCKTTNVAQ